ncbi:MAG: CehA/McbA family metallohydrolase [Myxococcales bacterium]
MLTGNGLRLVVGGLLREGDARGAVLEMSVAGNAPSANVVLFRQTVHVDGVEHKIRVLRMSLIERMGMPALRIEGVVPLDGRQLDVARELSIGRVEGTLSVSTRLYSAGGERSVHVGARLAWGGPIPFMPGVGAFDDEQWHRADWVGGEGPSSSVCFGFERGGVSARARFEEHAGAKLLVHTDVAQAQGFALEPGVPHYEKNALVLAAPGLASAVRTFGMWRSRMFPEVWIYLPERPVGSQVMLSDANERELVRGLPDVHGRVVLPLVQPESGPVERYVAVATAYGHAASEALSFRAGDFGAAELVIPAGGQIRVRVHEAGSHEPLAARVRIAPLGDTKPVSLGPDYRASGAGDTVIALRGQAWIDVPQGRYRVQLSHGPEWTLFDAEVDVTETYGPLVDAELVHQVDPGNWIGCDLHLHAAPSPDSEVSLDDRLASLVAEGVQFAVATDHNHVTDYAPSVASLALDEIAVESGVEVTTEQPTFGHFNAYPVALDPTRQGNGAPAYSGVDPGALFRSLHALDPDLVVQVNHPRSTGGIGYFEVMSYDPSTDAADPRFSAEFDTLEVFNGFDLGQRPNVDRVFDDWLTMLARGKRVAATGSSDSHQVRYQLAGYPRTYVSVPELDQRDSRAIIRAIKAGASFVTSGPFLEVELGGGGPGTTVSLASLQPAGEAKLSVKVRAPDWMPVDLVEIFVGTERVLAREVPKPASRRKGAAPARGVVRLSERFPLTISQDSFVVVRVSSQESVERFSGRFGMVPLAFSNPIFVDADGDGQTRWSPP